MTNAAKKNLLLISPLNSVTEAIAGAFASDPNIHVDTEAATLSQMNGKAIKALPDYDVIMFQTSPQDERDMEAIGSLVSHRKTGTLLVALADGDISLTQARALSNAGVDEVLPLPQHGNEVDRKFLQIGRAPAARADGQQKSGRIIAVAQARGGVGSTTVAVNLADLLVGKSRRGSGRKVALVDFDLQFGTIGSFLDLSEQDTLLQLALDGTIPDTNFLKQSMVEMPNGLSVLASPSSFAPLDSLRPDQVASILDTLRQNNDFIVIDLPRALVNWIEPIVQRADEIIVVTDLSVSSVRHCRRLIDFFTQDNPSMEVEVVVNHQHKPMFKSRIQREASKALEHPLDHWLPHDPRAASAAADRGRPLSLVAPRSPLGKAMNRLARATVAGAETKTPKPRQ